jgi:hypothetical protein
MLEIMKILLDAGCSRNIPNIVSFSLKNLDVAI